MCDGLNYEPEEIDAPVRNGTWVGDLWDNCGEWAGSLTITGKSIEIYDENQVGDIDNPAWEFRLSDPECFKKCQQVTKLLRRRGEQEHE